MSKPYSKLSPERAAKQKSSARAYYELCKSTGRSKLWKKTIDRRTTESRRDYNHVQSKKWRAKNKEKKSLAWKNWVSNNRERQREYLRQYYLKNSEKIKQRAKEWWDNASIEQRLKRYGSNKKWEDKNSDKRIGYVLKRNALRKKCSVNLVGISRFINRIKKRATVVCYYCQEPTPSKGCHFDHIVPLSKGGLHAVENLCATCPTCNLKKHAKLLTEWVRIGQQVLSL